MFSALNDFVYVLLGAYHSDNICHILCTCIYLYEYSYGYKQMKNVCHIDYMNTRFLQCVFFCVQSCYVSL